MMKEALDWLVSNWIENLAVLTGIVYIVLSVKQRISCWSFGIVSSVLYLFVFLQSKIYADMILQAYYVIMGFYGWIHWARMDTNNQKEELPVSKISMRQASVIGGITLVTFFCIAYFLIHFTDSPVPWVDAFTTSLSFTATWMLARKILEHWIIWVIVDLVSVGLFFNRGLYASIVLFLIFTVLALIGYLQWIKEWKSKTSL
ncbi:MAG TPA: nicotinamide riboside transporter PnuC [Marinilabiliales bacterium]|nr:nicotinamide riboside transporter PnuC [Marinilabiliales bacterium]